MGNKGSLGATTNYDCATGRNVGGLSEKAEMWAITGM